MKEELLGNINNIILKQEKNDQKELPVEEKITYSENKETGELTITFVKVPSNLHKDKK